MCKTIQSCIQNNNVSLCINSLISLAQQLLSCSSLIPTRSWTKMPPIYYETEYFGKDIVNEQLVLVTTKTSCSFTVAATETSCSFTVALPKYSSTLVVLPALLPPIGGWQQSRLEVDNRAGKTTSVLGVWNERSQTWTHPFPEMPTSWSSLYLLPHTKTG